MTTSSVFINSDYVITILYSYLHVLMSKLIQSKSPLNQCWKSNVSELKKVTAEQTRNWFGSELELIRSCFSLKQRCSALKQRWIFQFWTALIQRKSALIFFMFSESALRNVKTMKQRCSALIISATSTRDFLTFINCYFLVELCRTKSLDVNFCYII